MSERQYKDAAGNPCTLRWLLRNEPEWAESQIRHRDTLERELAAASNVIAELAVKLDRANTRIARLEEAGDECARYSTAQASDDWHAAKEAKP